MRSKAVIAPLLLFKVLWTKATPIGFRKKKYNFGDGNTLDFGLLDFWNKNLFIFVYAFLFVNICPWQYFHTAIYPPGFRIRIENIWINFS